MSEKTHTCITCGWTWQSGQSGDHDCAKQLKPKLATALIELHAVRHGLCTARQSNPREAMALIPILEGRVNETLHNWL